MATGVARKAGVPDAVLTGPGGKGSKYLAKASLWISSTVGGSTPVPSDAGKVTDSTAISGSGFSCSFCLLVGD